MKNIYLSALCLTVLSGCMSDQERLEYKAERDSAIVTRCEELGFTQNTEKMAECRLEIETSNTPQKIYVRPRRPYFHGFYGNPYYW